MHVGSVRQTATILTMTEEHLRTGDKATVRFRFIKNPEYLKPDMRMVFREGRTKAVGNVTKLFPHVSAVAQNTRQTRQAKKVADFKHQTNPQNEPQKASKRNRRNKKSADMLDEGKNLTASAASEGGASSPQVSSPREGGESVASCSSASSQGSGSVPPAAAAAT